MKPIDYLNQHTEWVLEDRKQPNRFTFRFMGRMFHHVVHTDAEANNLLNGLMNQQMKEDKLEII